MRAEGIFTTHEFTAVDTKPAFEVRTGIDVGVVDADGTHRVWFDYTLEK